MLKALQRHGTSYFLPSGRQARVEEIRGPVEAQEGKEEAKQVMLSTISFIQANL